MSLLAALWKDCIFGSQKNLIKCKALFPQWNLKTCKLYGVSNTEEQFDFPRKLIPQAHRFFEKPLTAASDYYHNHILISRKWIWTSYEFLAKSTSCRMCWYKTNLRSPTFSFPTFFVSLFVWNENYVQLILIFKKYKYLKTSNNQRKTWNWFGKIKFIKTFINVAGAAFIFCVTF